MGPVEFDVSGVGSGAPLLCELAFEGGRVQNASALFGKRALFGVWVVQPAKNTVALRCSEGLFIPVLCMKIHEWDRQGRMK